MNAIKREGNKTVNRGDRNHVCIAKWNEVGCSEENGLSLYWVLSWADFVQIHSSGNSLNGS